MGTGDGRRAGAAKAPGPRAGVRFGWGNDVQRHSGRGRRARRALRVRHDRKLGHNKDNIVKDSHFARGRRVEAVGATAELVLLLLGPQLQTARCSSCHPSGSGVAAKGAEVQDGRRAPVPQRVRSAAAQHAVWGEVFHVRERAHGLGLEPSRQPSIGEHGQDRLHQRAVERSTMPFC
jgi:hypothetical protein